MLNAQDVMYNLKKENYGNKKDKYLEIYQLREQLF